MTSKGIQHGPGVVCMIRGLTTNYYTDALPGHGAMPYKIAQMLVRERNGLILTIESRFDASKTILTSALEERGPAWWCQLPRAISGVLYAVTPDGSRSAFVGLQPMTRLAIYQKFLVPIAGPEIDLGEDAGIKTPEKELDHAY